jgi:hypothetical protein
MVGIYNAGRSSSNTTHRQPKVPQQPAAVGQAERQPLERQERPATAAAVTALGGRRWHGRGHIARGGRSAVSTLLLLLLERQQQLGETRGEAANVGQGLGGVDEEGEGVDEVEAAVVTCESTGDESIDPIENTSVSSFSPPEGALGDQARDFGGIHLRGVRQPQHGGAHGCVGVC